MSATTRSPGAKPTSPRSRRSAKTAQNRGSGRPQVASPDNWEAWLEYLRGRQECPALRTLLSSSSSDPLCWPLADEWPGTDSQRLVQQLSRLGSRAKFGSGELVQRLENWLDTVVDRKAEPLLGIESLAWCHALPTLAQTLPAAPWHQLLDQLIQVADQAAGIDLLEQPLSQQLLAGELPLSLSYVLPEISACSRLAESAGRILSQGMVELLDGEGLLQARNLQLMRPLLACWTRASCIDRTLTRHVLTDDANVQFEWLVRQTMRLMRYDGSQVFSTGAAGAWQAGLVKSALEVAGDADDRRIAAQALPGRQLRVDGAARLPEPAVYSEWAETAVLRRDWTRKTDQLTVTYANQDFCCELNCGPETIWSGSCNPTVAVDGRTLGFRGDWVEVCSLCDSDMDYLELEIVLTDGRVLQRQMVLAREDRFLFVADTLLGEKSGVIDYQWTLPLTGPIKFEPAEESREGTLVGRRRLGRVLPLALPEWRSQRDAGQLTAMSDGLRYAVQSTGRRLFAPLFIDLDPRRFKNRLTWRQLTVAEHLQKVDRDTAAGYRIQIGSRHWLVYRSLGPTGNRSVLGQNFSTEFVVARFTPIGMSEKLVEIE